MYTLSYTLREDILLPIDLSKIMDECRSWSDIAFCFAQASLLEYLGRYSTIIHIKIYHYENMPIQIYWKFYHQKMKIFR